MRLGGCSDHPAGEGKGPIWIPDSRAWVTAWHQYRDDPVTQDRLLQQLSHLVRCGSVVYPEQVIDDVYQYVGKKSPLTEWLRNHRSDQVRPVKNGEYAENVKSVLSTIPNVIDNAGREQSAPYVLGCAAWFWERGNEVRIVTDHVESLPRRISMIKACDFLGLPHERLQTFLASWGFS